MHSSYTFFIYKWDSLNFIDVILFFTNIKSDSEKKYYIINVLKWVSNIGNISYSHRSPKLSYNTYRNIWLIWYKSRKGRKGRTNTNDFKLVIMWLKDDGNFEENAFKALLSFSVLLTNSNDCCSSSQRVNFRIFLGKAEIGEN